MNKWALSLYIHCKNESTDVLMPRWQRKKNSADHMIMINRRVCNRRVCNMQRASERAVASFANLAHTILRRLSFSTDRSYKLLGRQLWAVLSSEKSRSPTKAIKVSKSRHNSRIKLRMELSNDQKRDNTESYLRCKFQCSPFSVRCKRT